MKLLSLARDLQRRKARERHNLFVAEGIRPVEELLSSPLHIVGALSAPDASANTRLAKVREVIMARGIELTEVSERDFASASDTETPQGILAIGRIPERPLSSLTLSDRARLLVLDAIQDPGNVGTILRTAAAFDITATVATPGTVDLWNAKVVRGAMGALFRHYAMHASWSELDALLRDHDIALWGADAAGSPLGNLAAPARLAIVVGNEGNGLTSDARSRVVHAVSIPTSTTVESLNVAVAAGILLYHFRP